MRGREFRKGIRISGMELVWYLSPRLAYSIDTTLQNYDDLVAAGRKIREGRERIEQQSEGFSHRKAIVDKRKWFS
jgi:hypothetical protein